MTTDPVFRLGTDFEVRTDLGCLRKTSGEEVYLRPKTYQTLLYLLRNRHRFVTKEELASHVWSDTAVTDDALVQCIVELRKALGDAAREPRYVRTIPKVGYRFLGAVEELPSGTVAATLVEPVAGPVPPGTRVPWWQVSAAVAVVAVIVAAVFAGAGEDSLDLAALDPSADKPGVAVMLLDNQSRTAEIDWMREGLAEMLISGLSKSERLNVLGRKQLLTLMGRAGHAPEQQVTLQVALDIARRSNATYVVLGSFARMGQKTRIDVHIEDLNARRVASETLTVDRPDDVLTQVDMLAWKLARQFDTSLAEPAAVPAAGLTTNLDAYRYYSLGVSKAIAYHNEEAVDLFEKALELDPKFVLARARIGYVYAVTSPRWGLAKPHLDEAYRSADQLRESDRLLIQTWHAIANLDYATAIARLERLIRLYPYEVEAYDRLARLLAGELRHADAIEVLKRGLLVDPDSPDLYNTLGHLYLEAGQHADSIAARQRFVALAPQEANSYDSLGLSYHAVGRYDEAQAAYERALAIRPGFQVGLIHLGNIFAQTGRYRMAIDTFERYVQNAGDDIERSRGHQTLSMVYLWKGEFARARRAALRSDQHRRLAEGPDAISWATLHIDLLRGAGPASLPDLAAPIQSNRGVRASARGPYLLIAHHAINEGRIEEGLAHLRNLMRENPLVWNVDSFDDALAAGYLKVGRRAEAIAEFERLLTINPRYPRAHYYLGLAYEGKGMRAAAQKAFQQFLSVWSGADPDVPEIVDAKARLSRLTN